MYLFISYSFFTSPPYITWWFWLVGLMIDALLDITRRLRDVNRLAWPHLSLTLYNFPIISTSWLLKMFYEQLSHETNKTVFLLSYIRFHFISNEYQSSRQRKFIFLVAVHRNENVKVCGRDLKLNDVILLTNTFSHWYLLIFCFCFISFVGSLESHLGLTLSL